MKIQVVFAMYHRSIGQRTVPSSEKSAVKRLEAEEL